MNGKKFLAAIALTFCLVGSSTTMERPQERKTEVEEKKEKHPRKLDLWIDHIKRTRSEGPNCE